MARKKVVTTPATEAPHSTPSNAPRAAVDLAESAALARRLIALAAEQTRQALINLDLAKTGLAELEVDLASRGIVGGAS